MTKEQESQIIEEQKRVFDWMLKVQEERLKQMGYSCNDNGTRNLVIDLSSTKTTMNNNKQATVIYKIDELTKDVDYYAKMFPNNHFTLQELIDQVKKDALSLGGEFGYSVSGEWKEKCYCFNVLSRDTNLVEIEYLGIGKA